MCGPIAIAIPLSDRSWIARISGGLLYNTGRALTYALLGLIFGLAGMGLSLGGMQQWASIALGGIMILSVLAPRILRLGDAGRRIGDLAAGKLKALFGRLFRLRTFGSLLALGLLNGFLPCGLVYVALAGALVSGTAGSGALFMFLFGLGTLPMMLGISLAGNLLSSRFRARVSRIVPWFIIVLGLVFILRGMNLGIPYLSPELKKDAGRTTMECCDKK
jgi:sulfite exporter TauE/SafE